jgi:hypothetical protein
MAAELFAGLQDSTLAVHESELAAAERKAYTAELLRHPEWAADVRQSSDAVTTASDAPS